MRLITGDGEVVYMCEINATWPANRVTIYVEGGEEPLVVELPGQNVQVNEGVVGK